MKRLLTLAILLLGVILSGCDEAQDAAWCVIHAADVVTEVADTVCE